MDITLEHRRAVIEVSVHEFCSEADLDEWQAWSDKNPLAGLDVASAPDTVRSIALGALNKRHGYLMQQMSSGVLGVSESSLFNTLKLTKERRMVSADRSQPSPSSLIQPKLPVYSSSGSETWTIIRLCCGCVMANAVSKCSLSRTSLVILVANKVAQSQPSAHNPANVHPR